MRNSAVNTAWPLHRTLRGWLAAPTLALLVASPAVAQLPIVDPRPASQVADGTGRVDAATRGAVDQIVRAARPRGEILVVVTDSTGGQEPRAFATRLFNRVGIGSRLRNDGVLFFLALADRRAEIVLGDGIAVPTAVTDRIMAEVIVARMKDGDLAGALVEGTRAIADQVLPVASEAPRAPPPAEAVTPEAPPSAVMPPARSPVVDGFRHQGAPPHAKETGCLPVVGAGGLVGVGVAALAVGVLRRRRRRTCERCGEPMERLGEPVDDDHLSPAELAEERLGSVDYDVWMCGRCGTTRKLAWRSFWSAYGACDRCGARTSRSRSKVVTAATESSTGLAEITESCEHCGHHARSTRIIPRRPTPTPSTRSSFSSSSSSSSAGRGGTSSGRGSSGSW